jgi:hypothetical protein
MVDSTGFLTGGNENAASIIQSVGVTGPTCRTEERASLETTKCVIERPTLVSAKCAEEILAGRNQNMGGRQLGCCGGRMLKKPVSKAAASEDRRRTLWGTLRI